VRLHLGENWSSHTCPSEPHLGAELVMPIDVEHRLDAIGRPLNSRADACTDRQPLPPDGLIARQRRILREPLAPRAGD